MPRRGPRRRAELPGPGEAFLMTLDDGRNGVCRVLRRSADGERVLVAASPWIGDGVPDPGDPQLTAILTLTHHSWQGTPELIWVSDPVPEGFRPLGTIGPLPSDERLERDAFGGWEWLPLQVLLQWRWDHDRERVLGDDAERARAEAAAREGAVGRRRAYLEGLTLEKLRRKRRFAGWKGWVPDGALRATRGIFRETVDAILAIGKPRDPRRIVRALRHCIESLNRLDEAHDHFIETSEREDLCAEFDEIVFASGFRNCANAADRWREW